MSAGTLAKRVNDFVEWLFKDSQPSIPKGPKVINDALLGTQNFAPHEVAIIDSPLLQRLKGIRQTGLVYHVYPSSVHSRFEHSLGVTTLAERCFNAIKNRASLENIDLGIDDDRFKGDLASLRMAALLHDVGHGLCSHASEQISKYYNDLSEFKKDPEFVNNESGEIISYLIIKSPRFKIFFNQVRSNTDPPIKIGLDEVAKLVIGEHKNVNKYFLAQIISSPFDADKLDYIARDSFYCGLSLTVDLPRYYGMISTEFHEGRRKLVLRSYVPLEQIIFSKMTLFGSVYHHQKVKCLDHMLRSMINHIITNPEDCAIPVDKCNVTFKEPIEFLYVTDLEFFNQYSTFGDKFLKAMFLRFKKRELFVRCVEISRRTINNWEESGVGRALFSDISKHYDELIEAEKLFTKIYLKICVLNAKLGKY